MNRHASTCPYCLTEGAPHPDQGKRVLNKPCSGQPLIHSMRFACLEGHQWLTSREEARLQGVFLERQRAAP